MKKNKSHRLTRRQKGMAIKIAKDEWEKMDEIAIGDKPKVDPDFEGETLIGVWIQAWVFVHGEELEKP